jgi:hypothetical protein
MMKGHWGGTVFKRRYSKDEKEIQGQWKSKGRISDAFDDVA